MPTQQQIADVFGVKQAAVARWPVDHTDFRAVVEYALTRRNRRGRQMPPVEQWILPLLDLFHGASEPWAPLPEGEQPLDTLARLLIEGRPLPPDVPHDVADKAGRLANNISLATKRHQEKEHESGRYVPKTDVRNTLAYLYTEIRNTLSDELTFRLRDHPPRGLNESRQLVHDLADRLIAALNTAEGPYT